MPQFVALLRGINVGKGNRVPMAELRSVLDGLGYTQVVTLLNSGNAVFMAGKGKSAQHATAIAAAVCEHFDIEVPVIVKSGNELQAIASECPVRTELADHSRLLVAFAQDAKALAGLSAIAPLATPCEQFTIGQHAAYLLCTPGILESKAGAALLGKAGRSATTRNWATLLKLQALTNAASD